MNKPALLTTRLRWIGHLLLVSGLALPACGSEVTAPTQDTGVVDTILLDTLVLDTLVLDTTVPEDTVVPETTGGDSIAAEVQPPGSCEPGDGCFGESCDSAEDCLSGICTMHMGDKVCSKTCDEACPTGWACTLVGVGSDGQYVCMSKFSHLCLPCETSEGCLGNVPNACVRYMDGTSFCGGSCDLENSCPSGYACQEADTTNGAKSYQCVSTAGVCLCSNLSIDSALSTPCEVNNDLGTCEGVRICSEEGLTACSATEASPEACNGIDDDCDGLVDEETCDDGNDCSTDSCAGEAGCTYELLAEGECLDGDVCTIADHCEAGVCVGKVVDCDDENPCTTDSCDGLGGCKSEPIVAICDDGDPCTLGDICSDGACKGSVNLVCDDANTCTDDSCGEGGCVFASNTEGCDDANACTSGDQCAEGACTGAQIACDDGEICTTDSCDVAAGCTVTNNTQPCSDGDNCTLADQCLNGACISGSDMGCDDGNPCTDDGCDAQSGCVFSPNPEPCDDNNACTTGDSCLAGNCGGIGSLTCDDGNPCTDDSCVSDSGCKYAANIGACSDGDLCTVNDTCTDGQCVSGAPPLCDDGNPCTEDSCVSESGCSSIATIGACSDDDLCTVDDTCTDGQCVSGAPPLCDDGNPCTDDSCVSESGCNYTATIGACSDGDPCTVDDTCTDGQCVGGAPPLCDDDNSCTDDACSEGECVFTPNVAQCDDEDACTDVSECEDGTCLGSAPVVCNDENPCTDDFCDPGPGCDSAPNVNECSDNDPCTVGDACEDSACQAGAEALSCDDGSPCTDDSCEPGQGCSFLPITPCCGNNEIEGDEQCDDGNQEDEDACTNACNLGPGPVAVTLTGNPDASSVFNTIERTFFYGNNLTSGIWVGASNQILTGHYEAKGYYLHSASQGGHPNKPTNGSGFYGRMVHMPSTGRVVWTNVPNKNGMGPADSDQVRIGSIDAVNGSLLAGGSAIQYSDDYSGTCNVLSSSATDLFILENTTTVRRYSTSQGNNLVTLENVITLDSALPTKATCEGGNCYGGTFAWDGKYFYFAESQTGQNQKTYLVYAEDGAFIASHNVTGPGGVNGLYFDWSVGRYASHDGYGGRSGGSKYPCEGCPESDDSQCYGPPSSAHSF